MSAIYTETVKVFLQEQKKTQVSVKDVFTYLYILDIYKKKKKKQIIILRITSKITL